MLGLLEARRQGRTLKAIAHPADIATVCCWRVLLPCMCFYQGKRPLDVAWLGTAGAAA